MANGAEKERDIQQPKIVKSTVTIQGVQVNIEELLNEINQKVNILWEQHKGPKAPSTLYFPDHVAKITPPEVMRILRDVQKCYDHDIPNACPGLLRKALASAIKIKFYQEDKKNFLYDARGDRKGSLRDWINVAKQQGYLSSEIARKLEKIKLFGDIGVHDEKIKFDKREISDIFEILRLAIEHMYRKN